MLTVNVSAPSVAESAVAVTVKLPALLEIAKLPELAEKSPAAVVVLLTVQYNVVASATLVVATLNVKLAPSLTEAAAGVTEYVGAASVTVTVAAVATTVPEVLVILNWNIRVSDPS